MGYRLLDNEPFADAIKRMVFEQIDTALEHLKPTVRTKDEAIHDARVCIKKTRALLRLVRNSLGSKIYKSEDLVYRDAGRKLSQVRDAAALIETVDKLIEHFSDQLSTNAFGDVRSPLMRSKRERQARKKKAMAETAKSLRAARRRVEEWPGLQTSDICPGLRRVFKIGRARLATASKKPSVENLHEWRKQVKHFLYQTHVLRPIWPTVMEGVERELKTLGAYLSEDHDLSILRERVAKQSKRSDESTEIETLVALIDQRRGELQLKAKLLGARIYAERPGAFEWRIQQYWLAWRSEVKVDPIAGS